MPWDTNDYPSSLKNLETPVRKKAIEIGNAMLDDGHDESRAIPIATDKAKEWYENASDKEIKQMEQKSDQALKERDDDDDNEGSDPELFDMGEHVLPHENGWAVQADDAKKPDQVFDKKQDAIDRAREIAKKKQTHLVIQDKDGNIQDRTSYEEQRST
ncbi:DUF2188 domain-containing protein [Salsuginibacillus kocurii]|uniref:DUF2188 domain-containing protein n=1 Tax=Salsuginibacillus kocurii TaxID=427078 RepID=UPI00036E6E5E|nr:DUF2188 domain-containing protein [Salsuginibacillus kocurii]